jgi:hypothetical protein
MEAIGIRTLDPPFMSGASPAARLPGSGAPGSACAAAVFLSASVKGAFNAAAKRAIFTVAIESRSATVSSFMCSVTPAGAPADVRGADLGNVGISRVGRRSVIRRVGAPRDVAFEESRTGGTVAGSGTATGGAMTVGTVVGATIGPTGAADFALAGAGSTRGFGMTFGGGGSK